MAQVSLMCGQLAKRELFSLSFYSFSVFPYARGKADSEALSSSLFLVLSLSLECIYLMHSQYNIHVTWELYTAHHTVKLYKERERVSKRSQRDNVHYSIVSSVCIIIHTGKFDSVIQTSSGCVCEVSSTNWDACKDLRRRECNFLLPFNEAIRSTRLSSSASKCVDKMRRYWSNQMTDREKRHK